MTQKVRDLMLKRYRDYNKSNELIFVEIAPICRAIEEYAIIQDIISSDYKLEFINAVIDVEGDIGDGGMLVSLSAIPPMGKMVTDINGNKIKVVDQTTMDRGTKSINIMLSREVVDRNDVDFTLEYLLTMTAVQGTNLSSDLVDELLNDPELTDIVDAGDNLESILNNLSENEKEDKEYLSRLLESVSNVPGKLN